MAELLLRGGRVVLPDRIEDATDVLIREDTIARIAPGLPAAGAEVVDVSGLLVAPGLIDVHIHGAAGAMIEPGDPEAIRRVCAELPRFGVTGFLATIATLSREGVRRAVRAVASVCGRERGARILGIHLEGPYLSPLRAGAQFVDWMRAPSVAELDELWDLSGERIRLLTLAPELDGACELIAAACARGIRVSVGHSDATAAQMRLGIDAGARHVTHLFNAMRGLHHREPGVAGVALTDDRLSVELICDGHHLAPGVVDLVFRCKPVGKVVLVSDAVAALGMPEGDCDLFGVRCTIAGGAVRLREGGNLAGSCLSLDHALRNVRSWLPARDLHELVTAATAAPAAVVGDQGLGQIREGGAADLVLFDADLNAAATICRGAFAWRS